MGATAYLVAWRDGHGRGRIVDAGIYSEASPTIALASDRRTQCLIEVSSRYEAGQGGFERASRRLRDIIARSFELRWVYAMPTFRRMQLRRVMAVAA